MKNVSKIITYVLFLSLFVTGIALLYTAPKQKPEKIALNRLVQEINADEVKRAKADALQQVGITKDEE